MTAAQIVGHLEAVVGPDGAPRRMKQFIENELRLTFNLSAIEAAELADKRIKGVSRLIASRALESSLGGIIYPLVLVGSSNDSVAGICCALSYDSPEVVQLKRQRLRAEEVLLAIKALTFDQFEKFGSKILTELGATHTRVTPHSNDQGIDFYGELNIGAMGTTPAPFLRLAHDVRLIFAGQAKHYPNSALNPDVVRELVGAIGLARTKTFSNDSIDLFDGVSLRPFSPLLAMLFTTGKISAGAAHLAAEAGIVAKSGEQLAVFLADKGVGMLDSNGTLAFDQAHFLNWLNA